MPYEFVKVDEMEKSDSEEYRILSKHDKVIFQKIIFLKNVQVREQLVIFLVQD